MDRPQRHHFVPQFYLREWYLAGKDHFLLYGRDPSNQLYSRLRASKSVGFKPDLYAIEPDGLNFQTSNSYHLESEFFSPIDNLASKVHQKLLTTGLSALTTEDRIDWAKFISSMLYRSEKHINEATKISAECMEQALEELGPQRMAMLNQAILTDLGVSINKRSLAKNLALEQITRAAADKNFVQVIALMRWALVKIPAGEDHFLTSDSPVVINDGLNIDPVCMLSLAISPKLLMVIYQENDEFDEILTHLAVVYNGLLMNQTTNHLVSSKPLANGRFIKYEKMVESFFRNEKSVLR